MEGLENFRFQVWRDGQTDMCAFRAEMPESQGLKYLWFVMNQEELRVIVSNSMASAVDGYHNLRVMGDLWTFYDLELPIEPGGGTLPGKYYNMIVPRFFARMLWRMAKKVWGPNLGNVEREPVEKVEFTFSKEYQARISRLYGQGKGQVKLQASKETETSVLNLVTESCQFAEQYARLCNIAQNSTRGFHQTAILKMESYNEVRGRLSKVDEFYWCAFSHNGSRLMNGGLINHGAKDGKHDWSIHT